MQAFLKFSSCVQYQVELQRWRDVAFSPSAALNYFTPSRKILAVPCQDEEGNLNFPSEMGGAEALWCPELLPKVGRAAVGSAVLGRSTESSRESRDKAGRHFMLVLLERRLEVAGKSRQAVWQLWAGQTSKIKQGKMTARKSPKLKRDAWVL